MNFTLRVPLNTTPDQAARLLALQQVFAQVCNALAPIVAQARVWNRVALHHMTYKSLREQFPALGSQMVCNAIYSVSRTCRLVYQHPQSPFNVARLGDKPLPLIRFATNCPVYFDRHTLSLKDGNLSMYTQEGRMRFQLALDAVAEARFHENKLREIVLFGRTDGVFELTFLLTDEAAPDGAEAHESPPTPEFAPPGGLPGYVMVEETA